ncbi:MAG TPA: hypothetical protein VE998_06585 [Terriglobales bacterium]|nr:hypothetical protein [Terriglobales bacterium]
MILLLSSLSQAGDFARNLSERLRDAESVEWASNIVAARKLARKAPGEMATLMLDQSSIDLQSPGLDALVEETGALPMIVNLALNDVERVEREVRIALRRSQHQREAAVEVARKLLAGEIKSELTQVLLRLQFALHSPSIAAMEPSVKSAFEAAERIRERLQLPLAG